MKPVTIDPRYHDAVIFDLDVVVADTTAINATAWKRTFDDYLARKPSHGNEDHSSFTDDDYRTYVEGKPRHDGLADFLASRRIPSPDDQQEASFEDTAVPVFESAVDLVRELHEAGIATAICSSSRDCQRVLRAARIEHLFAVCMDGLVTRKLGLPKNPTQPSFLKQRADSARIRAGPSWSRTPRPGLRRAATAASRSPSVWTVPVVPMT